MARLMSVTDAFIMTTLICSLLLLPLGNPTLMYGKVLNSKAIELNFWEVLLVALPIVCWTYLFTIGAFFSLWIVWLETTDVRRSFMTILCSAYIFGSLALIVPAMKAQVSIGQFQVSVALLIAILVSVEPVCIYAFIWRLLLKKARIFR